MGWPRVVAFTSWVRGHVEGAQIHPGKRLFPGGKRQLQGQLAAGMTSPRMLRLPHLSKPLIQVRRVARSCARLHVPGSALTLLSGVCGFVKPQVTRGDPESPAQASGATHGPAGEGAGLALHPQAVGNHPSHPLRGEAENHQLWVTPLPGGQDTGKDRHGDRGGLGGTRPMEDTGCPN